MTGKKIFQSVIVLVLLLGAPVAAFADDEPPVTVTADCASVNFAFDLSGGLAPYTVDLKFGDTEFIYEIGQPAGLFNVTHLYPSQGVYEWTLSVTDNDGLVTIAEGDGLVTIDGPTVSLSSVPMPPLLTIESGEASLEFTADVIGGAGDIS